MKSGFVAIIGRPNVGKSTIVNALVGRKVSIITPKPQTTRNAIQGVLHRPDLQIVFVDTPGIHKPRAKLGELMNQMAFASMRDIEATLLVVDSGLEFGPGDIFLLEKIKENKNIIIVFNKIDTTTVGHMEILKSAYHNFLPDSPQIEVSAIRKANLEGIIDLIKEKLPEGPAYFPEGVYTNYPEAFSIAEIIREKTMLLTEQEIPHVIAVSIDKIIDKTNKREVMASIIVEKKSQKGIVIGEGGALIRRIGNMARHELEDIYKIKFELELFVRVEADWRDSLFRLKEFGFK
jgi:GTP-binding protein Era